MLFCRKYITYLIIYIFPFNLLLPLARLAHHVPCSKPPLQSLPTPCPAFSLLWFPGYRARQDANLGSPENLINSRVQPCSAPPSASNRILGEEGAAGWAPWSSAPILCIGNRSWQVEQHLSHHQSPFWAGEAARLAECSLRMQGLGFDPQHYLKS